MALVFLIALLTESRACFCSALLEASQSGLFSFCRRLKYRPSFRLSTSHGTADSPVTICFIAGLLSLKQLAENQFADFGLRHYLNIFDFSLNLWNCLWIKMDNMIYIAKLILAVVCYGITANSLPLQSDNLLDVSWTAPCTLGEFRHSNGTCTACTICGDGQQVADDCTEQTDTVCSCKSGTFLDATSNTCQECRECPSGTSIVRECSKTFDTECSVCPEGQFFDVTDNTCSHCSRCGPQETMLKRCSPNLDTICMPAMVFGSNSKRIRSSPTATTPKSRPKKNEKDDVDYERPSIFYFLPFCGIIVVTSIYAVIKNYESQTNRPFRLSCASLFHCLTPQRSSPCTTAPNLTITVNPTPLLNPPPSIVSNSRIAPLTSFHVHSRPLHNSAYVLPQQAMALTDRADYDSDVCPLRRPRMPTA